MSALARPHGDEQPWRRLLKPGKPVEVIDEDTGEIIDVKPEQTEPNDVDGLLVQFTYEDASHNDTERTILCKRCWESAGVIYVQGVCTLRHALRTFRAERMSDLIEVRSGRNIENPQDYFGHFADEPEPEYFRKPISERAKPKPPKTAQIPAAKTRAEVEADALSWHRKHRARRICIDGLRILAYMALSDGVRNDHERNIEESYIESRLAIAAFDHDPKLTDAMVAIAAGLAVPFSSLKRSIDAVSIDPDHHKLVINSARAMIEADGGADDVQSEALKELIAGKRPPGRPRKILSTSAPH